MSKKEEALQLVQMAREAFTDGKRDLSVDLLNEARECLLSGSHTPASLPGIFGWIDHTKSLILGE